GSWIRPVPGRWTPASALAVCGAWLAARSRPAYFRRSSTPPSVRCSRRSAPDIGRTSCFFPRRAEMDLQFRNLRIRNAVASDAPQLTRWWNDGSVMAHAGFPHGLGTTEEEVAGKLAQDREETGRCLILELDGAPVGEMCYRIVEGNKAQIGIKICEAARQEQGYGRIALSLLIRALFDRG